MIRNDIIFFSLQELDQKEILGCLAHGIKNGQNYPESVRQLCLSVHFHSPSAYNVLRETFNKNILLRTQLLHGIAIQTLKATQAYTKKRWND